MMVMNDDCSCRCMLVGLSPDKVTGDPMLPFAVWPGQLFYNLMIFVLPWQ